MVRPLINKDDFEYELYEIFKEQFINNMVQIENNILELENSEHDKKAINNLFRIFHTLKANSQYFHFESMSIVADKTEKVLASLREGSAFSDISVIKWLIKVQEQCFIWSHEMENDATEFSQPTPSLLNEIEIKDSHTNALSLLKQLSVLYFDINQKRSQKLLSALEKNFLKVKEVHTLDDFEQKLILEQPNICIINIGKDTIKASKLSQQHVPNSAIIVVFDKLDHSTYLKLGVHGIYHTILNPIMGDELKRVLLSVIDSHFTSRQFIITNQKIKDFIETLQPLSVSILQIQRICDDEEASIKELIKAVKLDPVISGMILKTAKNPIYGLEEISTIDQAVSIFGKTRVKAISLSQMIDAFGRMDLSPYNITESIFSNVAALRLMLMIKWYSKVSISSLAILSTTAILGNIGQLLIAREINVLKKKTVFLQNIQDNTIQIAEEKCMRTTTASVSSDILSYWQLEMDIVDSVRFSDNPEDGPEQIYSLCLANHVVYRLVQLDGKVLKKVPKNIEKLLQKNKLRVEPLQKALDAINNITQERN